MECLKPIYLAKREQHVPCGRCIYCNVSRANAWSTRLYWEYRRSQASAFVSLTYEDQYLTYFEGKYYEGVAQLVRSDLQKYFKRLRKAGVQFKYYAVGEYGSRYGRPHFHILFFFSSDFDERIIREKWSMGIVHVGQVSTDSINYCLSYISLRRKRGNRVHEFALMSKGLGDNYHKNAQVIAWHKSGRKNYCYIEGKKVALARYYKEKIFSKIDRVRIAVATEKEFMRKMVRYIRSPVNRKLRDPLAKYERARKVLADRIYLDKVKQKKHVGF